MNPIELENKIKEMSTSLKDKDIVEYFPTILNNLEFIIETYNTEITGLSEEDRINNIYNIEYQKIDYLAELIKKYMELTWQKEFRYEIIPGYLFNSTAGYNQRDDIVTISIFGMILNSTNTIDSIRSIAHEFRHQLQYRFLHEKDFESILTYPPYFITIMKNALPKEIKKIIDEEGYVIGKPYYQDNYKRIYTEVDANLYGVELATTFLKDLYNKYPNKIKNLEKQLNKIQKEIEKEKIETVEGLKNEKRIDDIYVEEIRTNKPITSTVIVDGEEKDALLYTDKCIKEEPLIDERFEVLKLLTRNNVFKNYYQLIIDKYRNREEYGNVDKVNELYENIVRSDPILTISKYILNKDKESIKNFLKVHPTFIDEYKDELDELLSTLTVDNQIVNLFEKEENIQKKK